MRVTSKREAGESFKVCMNKQNI